MGNDARIVTYQKKSGFWTAIKIILAVAAIGFVAYKIYKKYFCKKAEELPEEEETLVLEAEDAVAEEEISEPEAFEAPAEAVIANAEEL